MRSLIFWSISAISPTAPACQGTPIHWTRFLLCACGRSAGCRSWVEIAKFGEKKLALLRRFRPFKTARPRMTNSAISSCPHAEQFQRCFIAWVSSSRAGSDIIASMARRFRRSYQDAGAKAPIHMISAWEPRARTSFWAKQVADKSNEITAIRSSWIADDQGATVTIDAMAASARSPRRSRTRRRLCSGAEGQPGQFARRRRVLFTEQRARHFADLAVDRHETVEKMPLRIETRITTVTDDIGWLKQNHGWRGLRSIVMVETVARDRRQESSARRAFTSPPSLPMPRLAAGHPQPLEHRERASLGDGHGIPRRRMPQSEEECGRPTSPRSSTWPAICCVEPRQGQPPRQAPPRRLGRRLPLQASITR